MGIQTAGTEYILPVFGIPPQTASGWDHTHNPILYNGYPSAAGEVQAKESSPVRDRRSTTELHR